MAVLLEARGIVKRYPRAAGPLTVLQGIDLRLRNGQFMAVMGASGSGKSTLLNILGCLDRPSAGTYRLDGVDVASASDERLSHLRSRCIGFVFQTFNLISHLTVAQNVALPFLYRSDSRGDADRRVGLAIEQVGLQSRRDHRPGELSGGEMQRVAVARALAIDPSVILADEPTGNLDARTSRTIMDLFQRLHRQGRSIVLVTHDRQVASCADACIFLQDGRIVDALE
jgi:putative ABC transport system ATP-binding protein